MKLSKYTAWLAFLLLFFINSLFAENVVYQRLQIEGIPVDVVTVNLNSSKVEVKPVLAVRNNGLRNPAEYFYQFIKRLTPKAMINGTFHDSRTYHLAGTVIIDGQTKSFYRRGLAVVFKTGNRIDFLPAKLLPAKLPSGFDAITAGPTLIYRGKINLYPKAEGFSDPSLYRAARRSAIGKTVNRKLIMVAVNQPIYLRKLARIMKVLKCSEAVSLDGGGSTGLYFKGKNLHSPIRPITNVLVVYEKKRVIELSKH